MTQKDLFLYNALGEDTTLRGLEIQKNLVPVPVYISTGFSNHRKADSMSGKDVSKGFLPTILPDQTNSTNWENSLLKSRFLLRRGETHEWLV